MLSGQEHAFQAFSVYSYSTSAFETECDAFGFEAAQTAYLLEVQADMQITEYGFDSKLLAALEIFDDLIMISGRGIVPLTPIASEYRKTLGTDRAISPSLSHYILRRALIQVRNVFLAAKERLSKGSPTPPPDRSQIEMKPAKFRSEGKDAEEELYPSQEVFQSTGTAGRVGLLIEEIPSEGSLKFPQLWVGQTIMRGPLMIRTSMYRVIGGLDTQRFFQGFDDIELAWKAFRDHGYRCAFLPVGFLSPLAAGSTRRRRSLKSEWQILKNVLRIRRKWKSSALYLLSNGQEENLPPSEIRSIS
jgi:hypothetical protein